MFLAILFIASPATANFFPDIIVTSPNGIWTDSRAYTTLQGAIDAVGVSDREIVIAKTETCTDLTIPSNIRLRFTRGGSIANTGQLTINTKDITAGDLQIFTGPGDIDFVSGSVVRSTWFSNIVSAITLTNDDSLTLIISAHDNIDGDCVIGDDVVLRWESSDNIITSDVGFTLSNIKNIEAGNYQLFVGAGDFDFLDGTQLNLSWFADLRSVITWVEDEEVTLVVDEPNTVAFDNIISLNISVDFKGGGIFDIGVGRNVTFNGNFDSPLRNVFTGSGTVSFGPLTTIVHPEWWGDNVTPGTTEMADEIQLAIDSLPAVGGVVKFTNDIYRVSSTLTFPIGEVFPGHITNIRIQGSSSGLSSGTNVLTYGTRINSHISDGAVFDLLTGTPTCVNVQFRDLEFYDVESTGYNYGIRADRFQTGCIIENVGFKNFSIGLSIESYAYYSKLDRVVAYYSRREGMAGIVIRGANGLLINRCQASNGLGMGMWIDNAYGVSVNGCWFERNAKQGLYIRGNLAGQGAVNISGNYFEDNGSDANQPNLSIEGDGAGTPIKGGHVSGNIFYTNSSSCSIGLGYAEGIVVTGNKLDSYHNQRCIYSVSCKDCSFIGNWYHPIPASKLDVPARNTIIEPQLSKNTLFSATATPVAGTWVAGDIVWNSAPSPGELPGWLCVTGGTPGTWEGIGELGTLDILNEILAPAHLIATADSTIAANQGVNDALYLNAKGTGAVGLARYGTGGVAFYDGADSVVAHLNSLGHLILENATGRIYIGPTANNCYIYRSGNDLYWYNGSTGTKLN